MPEPRLASSVLIGAIRRQVEADGGFATVVARGDDSAGAVLIVLVEPDGSERVVERILQPDGSYAWQQIGNQAALNGEEGGRFLARRRNFDPDLWILELNIASAERFIAQINALV